MLRLNKLSIGTKLIVTSGIGILLMASMIIVMMIGNGTVRSAVNDATAQASISQMATDLRGQFRALQIGLRDMRLSLSLDASKQAMDYFHARQARPMGTVGSLIEAVKPGDGQTWVKKVKGSRINTLPSSRRSAP